MPKGVPQPRCKAICPLRWYDFGTPRQCSLASLPGTEYCRYHQPNPKKSI
jgi:hypothetical protein